ncbi:MAG: hypothetical protein U0R17_03055 [Acidimicrobiia bacterium]
MLDNHPPRLRKVNRPNGLDNISIDTSWDIIAKQIFAPCLAWQNGNIYSLRALQSSALDLVEAIRNLSYFSISHFETPDVKRFIEDYKLFLSAIELGPGIKKKQLRRKTSPNYKTFTEIAFDAITQLENEIRRIETESRRAYLQHLERADLDPDEIGVKSFFKSSVDLDGPLSLSIARLETFAAGRPVPNLPNRPGSSPLGVIDHSNETNVLDLIR